MKKQFIKKLNFMFSNNYYAMTARVKDNIAIITFTDFLSNNKLFFDIASKRIINNEFNFSNKDVEKLSQILEEPIAAPAIEKK